MSAVNRKNKCAYFENCSARGRKRRAPYATRQHMPRTEEELGNEGGEVVLAGGDVVVAEVAIRVWIVERNNTIAGQDLLLL